MGRDQPGYLWRVVRAESGGEVRQRWSARSSRSGDVGDGSVVTGQEEKVESGLVPKVCYARPRAKLVESEGSASLDQEYVSTVPNS